MDLSRAKTVLIFTFLFLNIFLLYHILEEEAGNSDFFSQEEHVTGLEEALEEADLVLDITLPRGGMRCAYLVVEPWRIEEEMLITELWNALEDEERPLPEVAKNIDSVQGETDSEKTIYQFGNYEVAVSEEGSLSFKRLSFPSTEEEYMETDNIEEDYMELAGEFIEQISFLQGFSHDFYQQREGQVIIYYAQEFEGFPLYTGYLQLFMSNGQIEAFHLYRLQPREFAQQTREIIPPSTALLRFLEAYSGGFAGAEILEFSLGYYSQKYDADRWEIPPAWRIRLSNDELYYINAFTGSLER